MGSPSQAKAKPQRAISPEYKLPCPDSNPHRGGTRAWNSIPASFLLAETPPLCEHLRHVAAGVA